jgi:short-subunit dehydrogenase
MKPYEGKNIWIIGASSGIGYALAVELSAQGARLSLSARSKDKLDTLNAILGGQHYVIPCDVSDSVSVQKSFQEVDQNLSNIDHIIFMAAVFAPGNLISSSLEDIHQSLAVNVGGAMNVVHTSVPHLKEGSQITLCGSVAGYRGLPNGQPYCATKAAIINLAESLKIDLASKRIDVKVINPGFVRTPLTDKNDFKMPMIIEPEAAAKIIAQELQSKKFEIHFPKRFTFIMKLLRIIPSSLYFKCVSRF